MGILNNGLKNKTFTNKWSLLRLTSPLLKQLYHSLVRGGSMLHFLSGLASTQTEVADIIRRHCITCNPPTLHIACMVKQEVSATSRFPCRVSEGSGGRVMDFCGSHMPLRRFNHSKVASWGASSHIWKYFTSLVLLFCPSKAMSPYLKQI